MSFRLTGVNGRPARSDVKQYLCDSVDDISKLPRDGVRGTLSLMIDEENDPCGVGSTALVKGSGVYILWPDNTWAKM